MSNAHSKKLEGLGEREIAISQYKAVSASYATIMMLFQLCYSP